MSTKTLVPIPEFKLRLGLRLQRHIMHRAMNPILMLLLLVPILSTLLHLLPLIPLLIPPLLGILLKLRLNLLVLLPLRPLLVDARALGNKRRVLRPAGVSLELLVVGLVALEDIVGFVVGVDGALAAVEGGGLVYLHEEIG